MCQIDSKLSLKNFLEADRIALGVENNLKNFLFDYVWRYQIILRKLEYVINCKKPKILRFYYRYRLKRLGSRLGFSIPPNVFGPGLCIAHIGPIIVNSAAKIGSNCRIHVCVNIGTAAGHEFKAPKIGKNCYIGPGVKMYGDIEIGDNVAFGANAVVNKSFPKGNCTLGGIPAKVISDKTSEGFLVKAWPLKR
ncbi:serine O-acetyltransferase [Rheinheimera tangshanensis]|uniref:Serine acetyltransferase n=1 Tax=Rheinheimera tangshanensis TaxID=400153 RepID=A0A5C8LT72_9GAMM|nr:serine acetyltransferase [Rheinheimera tangshanensis]TXK80561.1 serine acetyltransferase [Rheinheimera tangshanensis]GGM60298.1 serine acetyltransferase [Rheinheimera tangshanensis]